MPNQIPVPFYGSKLVVVDNNGEPFNPIKPSVEGMQMLSSSVNIAYLAQQISRSSFVMIAQIYSKWMENPNLKEAEKARAKMSGVHG